MQTFPKHIVPDLRRKHSQNTCQSLRQDFSHSFPTQEVARLEEIKKENIEKFVNTLRNELHKLWDDCFYTPEQRNRFR